MDYIQAASVKVNSLNIIGWNTQGWDHLKGSFLDKLGDYDIACIQEASDFRFSFKFYYDFPLGEVSDSIIFPGDGVMNIDKIYKLREYMYSMNNRLIYRWWVRDEKDINYCYGIKCRVLAKIQDNQCTQISSDNDEVEKEGNLLRNPRCSLGVIFKGQDNALEVFSSVFPQKVSGCRYHRPIVAFKYKGLPIANVHAPASSSKTKKYNYIKEVINKMQSHFGNKWIAVGDYNVNLKNEEDRSLIEKILGECNMQEYRVGIGRSDKGTHRAKDSELDYAIHGSDVICEKVTRIETSLSKNWMELSDHDAVLYEVKY